ncbi:SAM-dependent methyltransferase [Aequorivita soesokkakensis]|jgi:SAM-dependent methyltransferase|uniref:SAM-dependent methyltransferase n=1 Tax=Aequorivita soesokkakensis TaxID=1385699 RepID=A0A1A9LGL2_9FLAO|nr:class I SAM-dependent methyltransferase [Aequorivita soesokkakensis]OAD91891.1 SAM-dependent methyltransferase [Aequorivita soesokkakensis]
MNLLDKFHNWRRKQRWDRQYKTGRWESLKNEIEAIRYYKIIEFILRFSPKNPSILDIGCGDGLLTERMKPEDYSYFLGLDFSKESIKLASNKNLPKAEFLAADAVKFKPKQKFDIIIFNEAFYYIHETEKQNVLDRMLANLTEEGIIITSIYREGHGCWEYFDEDSRLEKLDFITVTTDEVFRYWKIGVYKKLI